MLNTINIEKYDNITPPNFNNPIVTDTKDSEVSEIPEKELKRMIIRMTNEIKQDVNEFTE
jgi:hypothetical protein